MSKAPEDFGVHDNWLPPTVVSALMRLAISIAKTGRQEYLEQLVNVQSQFHRGLPRVDFIIRLREIVERLDDDSVQLSLSNLMAMLEKAFGQPESTRPYDVQTTRIHRNP